MKALVVYSSKTGNTRRLAEAIHEGIPGARTLAAVEEAPPPEDFDWLAVGFWLRAGKPDPDAAAYLRRLGAQRLFLFATHGAEADSAHVREALAHARELAPRATLVGSFACPGEVNPKHLEIARHMKGDVAAWRTGAEEAAGRPNAADIHALQEALARALAD
jgi:hypothetical protein